MKFKIGDVVRFQGLDGTVENFDHQKKVLNMKVLLQGKIIKYFTEEGMTVNRNGNQEYLELIERKELD